MTNYCYEWGRGPQCTFILRALEEDYRHGEPLDFSRAALTIEHVLPQSLTPEWEEILADSGLAMNREVAGASGWGRAEIQARGRDLGLRVVSIWPCPDESVSTSSPDPHWALMNQAQGLGGPAVTLE